MQRLLVFVFSRSVQAVDLVERNENGAGLARPIGTALLQLGRKLVDTFPAVSVRVVLSKKNDLVIEC